jgi:hypothetical protein
MFPWYPIKRLIGIDIRRDYSAIDLMSDYIMHASHKDIMRNSYREYVAICEHEPFGLYRDTYEIIIPEHVVIEMTDEHGVVFTLDTHLPDPWQAVANHINAAALRIIERLAPSEPQ